MQKVLVVVDMQNDFIDGALGTKEAQAIVPNVKRKIEGFDGTVLFTRDTHEEDYLQTQEGKNLPVEHCIRGSKGWEIREELDQLRKTEPIDKVTFGSSKLGRLLVDMDAKEKLESITFIGLCTDICVISNVMIAKAFLPEVPIIVDASCCAGVSVESHENALKAMEVCQVKVERTWLSVLEWNIHLQGKNAAVIENSILNQIKNEDIIAFLEFNANAVNIEEIRYALYKKGYNTFVTNYYDCNYANDILLAVKSSINVVKDFSYKAYNVKCANKIPENLFLEIEINDERIVVGAVRIKELNSEYNLRAAEMDEFVSWVEKMNSKCIIVGDFNNLSENTPEKRWNMGVLDEKIKNKLVRFTPKKNCSWGVAYYVDQKKLDGYIKEDHLLCSKEIAGENKCNVEIINYSWDFLKDYIAQGIATKDSVNQYNQERIRIPVGIPDHAIMRVTLKV